VALTVFFMDRNRLDQPNKISTLTKEESYV